MKKQSIHRFPVKDNRVKCYIFRGRNSFFIKVLCIFVSYFQLISNNETQKTFALFAIPAHTASR